MTPGSCCEPLVKPLWAIMSSLPCFPKVWLVATVNIANSACWCLFVKLSWFFEFCKTLDVLSGQDFTQLFSISGIEFFFSKRMQCNQQFPEFPESFKTTYVVSSIAFWFGYPNYVFDRTIFNKPCNQFETEVTSVFFRRAKRFRQMAWLLLHWLCCF